MNIVFYGFASSFLRSLEQRSHVNIKTTVCKSCSYNFCTTVMSVLSHFGNHYTRTATLFLCKFFSQFASSCEICILFTF